MCWVTCCITKSCSVMSVLLCQSREVPLHMQKIAGKTMPLERHGSLKSDLYLKGGRLPLPTLVGDTWCERVIVTGLNKSSLCVTVGTVLHTKSASVDVCLTDGNCMHANAHTCTHMHTDAHRCTHMHTC